ncbi:MAG: COQ9 family protein [Alphaproteobacteria bacterium]|nr:COQ9 family protein [Alphaproteobacteria bacterium]
MARAKRVNKGATPTEKLREKILREALPHVAFDGWTDKMLKEAADRAGADDAEFKSAFPRGVPDALVYFSSEADRQMTEAVEAANLKTMKIRERVTFAVRQRIEAVAGHKEAARRAAAVFALPMHALDGATCVYRTCDAAWRAIGDTSTDFNFYTKRALLSGVYTSTMLYWFADNGEDNKDTWKFLDDRIANVMQIEKVKAQVTKLAEGLPNPLTILGALRYPKR